jgi:signal transduction histidine kinase
MRGRARVDLGDLAGDVVAERVEAADRRSIEVDLDVSTAVVEGDRWLLDRLVANLVDNAIRHNVDGGWLRVEVETINLADAVPALTFNPRAPAGPVAGDPTPRDGRIASIRVSNGGDDLTAEQVHDILEPFQRADRNRPGYGLGMTIVQAVVRAHGGVLVVEPRVGGGLVATVRLPLAPRVLEAPTAPVAPTPSSPVPA